MSSPRRKAVARKPMRAAAKPTKGATVSSMSADATRLAAAMELSLASGRADVLTPDALQGLMAALCKSYAARIESGAEFTPLAKTSDVAPTDVMVMASGLLKSANLAVFELGMWQSWTGR